MFLIRKLIDYTFIINLHGGFFTNKFSLLYGENVVSICCNSNRNKIKLG